MASKIIQDGLKVQTAAGADAFEVDGSTGAVTVGPNNTATDHYINGNLRLDGGTAVSAIMEWRSTINSGSRRYQWRQDIDAYGDFGLLGGGADNTANPNIKFIYVSSAGAVTLGNSTSAGAYPLTVNGSDSGFTSIPIKVAGTTRGNIGASTTQCLRVINAAHTAENGSCTDAGAWTLGSTSSGSPTHKIYANGNAAGTPALHVIKNSVAINTSGNSYIECYGSSGGFDGYIGVSGTALSVIDASDSRKKENIREANFGLAQVNALRPVLFDWKEEFGGEKDVKGFIAQEVESVLPECVTTKDESESGGFADSKFLAQTNMIPVLVKAIQEQQAMIEALQAEVAALKGQ